MMPGDRTTTADHVQTRYRNSDELEERLAKECAGRQGVAVAVRQRGSVLYASYGGGSDFSAKTPVVVGCIAKCLTATLFANATVDELVGCEDEFADVQIGDALPLSAHRRNVLAGITVEHLLNHTHGLDDSAVEPGTVPRLADGSIDLDVLCEQVLRVPRIAAPGAMYSYGGVGSWLIAGLLERRLKQPYIELLRRYVPVRWPPEPESVPPVQDVCPAWGGKLRMSALQFLEFVTPHTAPPRAASTENRLHWLRRGEIEMPGWGPWQKAATAGWNRYGSEWLGHNGNQDGTGIAIRFHRRSRTAIVVTAAREQDCFFALARLFGDVLEEFSADYVRFPKPLGAAALKSKDLSEPVGHYANAQCRIEVEEAPAAGCLRMRVYDRTTESVAPVLSRYIKLADQGVFMTIPQGIDYPFVQFVAGNGEGGASYLWNGRQLWRRSS